jgi:hypothetical protein
MMQIAKSGLLPPLLRRRSARSLALLLLLGLSGLNACSTVHGEGVSTDEALRDHVVGRWVVARNSADYVSLFSAREEYKSDGTYSMLFFEDSACSKVIGELDASWNVTQGVLSLEVTHVSERRYGRVGDVTRDRILGISDNTFTLQPTRWLLALNTHYIRHRSDGCTANSAKAA